MRNRGGSRALLDALRGTIAVVWMRRKARAPRGPFRFCSPWVLLRPDCKGLSVLVGSET